MIPNVIHFVFLSASSQTSAFGLIHYLAVKSAHCVNNPDRIIVHCDVEPAGDWWEKARPLVHVNLVLPPTKIFGNALCHVAHQADIVRLHALRELGGIYLDIDTICVRPLRDFSPLRFAIGQQFAVPHYYGAADKIKKCLKKRTLSPLKTPKMHGLCNGVLLAEKGSHFIDLWLESYRSFRSKGKDAYWDEHSVKMPLELARKHPDLITELSPYAFHYPLWDTDGLALLFERVAYFPRAYVHHLWQGNSWEKYLSRLSIERIQNEHSTYNRLARQFLP